MLGKATRENALQWKFQPASKEVPGNSATLTYVFLLEGKPQDAINSTFVFEMPNRVQIVAQVTTGSSKALPECGAQRLEHYLPDRR
jgi:hypothetical protein